MNRITKIAAVALMAFAVTGQAQTAKKEFTIDTGKGGIELKISVPEMAQGPYDFSGNDGIFKYDFTNKGRNYSDRKVAFIAKLGETGSMGYKFTLSKASSKNADDEGFTNKTTANQLLETEGFKLADAKPIENRFIPLDNAITETVKVCGQPVTDHPRQERECAIVVTSVTNDHLQSVGLMAVVKEKDVDAYNANPEKFSKRVDNAFNYMNESKAKFKN